MVHISLYVLILSHRTTSMTTRGKMPLLRSFKLSAVLYPYHSINQTVASASHSAQVYRNAVITS